MIDMEYAIILTLHYVESRQNSFKNEKFVFEYFWVEYLF